MVTHNDTMEHRPQMRGIDHRDGALRCYGRFELNPGSYRARATTAIPVESELLVFDREANLFLARTGHSPALEFELVRPKTVVVMGKVKTAHAALAPCVHVQSIIQRSRAVAA